MRNSTLATRGPQTDQWSRNTNMLKARQLSQYHGKTQLSIMIRKDTTNKYMRGWPSDKFLRLLLMPNLCEARVVSPPYINRELALIYSMTSFTSWVPLMSPFQGKTTIVSASEKDTLQRHSGKCFRNLRSIIGNPSFFLWMTLSLWWFSWSFTRRSSP